MKKSFEVVGATGEAVAKRMLKLAWDESSVFGMGVFQDRGQQDEESVWKQCIARLDYACNPNARPGRVSADYVFGRMMKLNYEFTATTVSGYESEWRGDYQSFCRKYKNLSALVKAACESLKCEIRESVAA